VVSGLDVPGGILSGRISVKTLECVASQEWSRAELLAQSLARPGLTVTLAVRGGDPAQEGERRSNSRKPVRQGGAQAPSSDA
jgi:hypothetical protein